MNLYAPVLLSYFISNQSAWVELTFEKMSKLTKFSFIPMFEKMAIEKNPNYFCHTPCKTIMCHWIGRNE